MTDMDLSRFAVLCDAYGGTIARWPAGERAAAARLTATGAGTRLLARAGRLDAALADWQPAPPSRELAASIALGAPPTRRGGSIGRWWPGLAGLTLAGAAAGALAVAALPPLLQIAGDDGGYADTVFGRWEAPR